MSDAGENPLEKVLRLCAGAAPQAWYPRVYAQTTGANFEALGDALEQLCLEGLVRKGGTSPEAGLGFVLSPAGQRLLADPAALRRLRAGEPLWPSDPGSVIRHSLLHPTTPVVSRLLILANVLVFLYGAYLDSCLGVKLGQVLHQSGSVSGEDILNGEWWRLLTACFVHGGPLHIAMNMYAVYAIGAFAEQTWGRLRFLLIYLIAGWGGSCLAVAFAPGLQLVGASGALCGILGAEGVWVLLAGKHLPPVVRRRAWRAVIINCMLITFISLLPGVSGWGHLGGALAGAAAALLLHVQRFSRAAWRWAALAALVPLPWLGVALIEWARAVFPAWEKLTAAAAREQLLEDRRRQEERERREEGRKQGKRQEKDFENRFLDPKSPTFLRPIVDSAHQVYQDLVPDPLEWDPGGLAPAEVKKALQMLDEQRRSVRGLVDALDRADPYKDEAVEKARQAARGYAAAEADLLDQARRCLRAGKRCTPRDREMLREQEKKVKERRRQWLALLD